MAEQPFSESADRPDLTVNMESRVGDLTVRQLSDIVGQGSGSSAKLKEAVAEKFPQKETLADKFPGKEIKDSKDNKEHKEQKDHKEPKDQKDGKEHKDQKDLKDSADQKQGKDHKEHKDHKDQKDFKDGIKDHLKDHMKDIITDGSNKLPETPGKGPAAEGPEVGPVTQPGIDELVQRVTGLEQQVAGMAQPKPS